MKITIFDIIHSPYAIDRSEGVKIYDLIRNQDPSQITISFLDIKQISTAFLNASIGKLAIEIGEKVKSLDYVFPDDRPLFKEKIEDVIENALLGEKYDLLLDHAQL